MLKTFKFIAIVVASFVIVLGGVPVKAASLPLYSIKDLGVAPGYSASHGLGMNNQGLAVGYLQIDGNGATPAIFANNAVSPNNSVQGFWTDINDGGLAVGIALAGTDYDQQAVSYQNGQIQLLGYLSGDTLSGAVRVNSSGAASGTSIANPGTSSQINHAVKFQSGNVISLGSLPGDSSSEGAGINTAGTVSGTSYDTTPSSSSVSRAVIFKNGSVVSLDTSGSCHSFSGTINDSEQVAGYVENCDNSGRKPVLFSLGGQTTILPLPSGDTEGVAGVISNQGIVLGDSKGPSDLLYHPTLYTKTTSYKLSDLVINIDGWTLENAYDVNDSGQIIGTGYRNGQQRAFLLVPILPINNLLLTLGLPPISLPPLLP